MKARLCRLGSSLQAVIARRSAHALARLVHASQLGLRISLSTFAIDVINPERKRVIRIRRDHWVYAQDMVQHFDYYFDSVEPFGLEMRDGWYEVADFSTPRYHAIRGFPDFAVLCPSLAEPFQTCQQYIELAHLQAGQTVLDLGCYCGLTTIAFARAVGPSGIVVALEPDPLSFVACQTNIRMARSRGNAADIRLLPMAAAGTTGTVTFSSEGAMGAARASIIDDRRGALITVQAIRLDDLARQQNLKRVDFIKMDIEGSEVEVLGAGEAFLRRFRPRIVIEPHAIGGVVCDRRVAEQLKEYGYRCRAVEQFGVSLPLIVAEHEEPT